MSGNSSPEQQAALHESLNATLNEINTQISYFESAKATHQAAIQRYQGLSTKYPRLAKFMQAEINDENDNIRKLDQSIQEKRNYLAYYESLMHINNPSMTP